jgi:serine/threonine protein kinase
MAEPTDDSKTRVMPASRLAELSTELTKPSGSAPPIRDPGSKTPDLNTTESVDTPAAPASGCEMPPTLTQTPTPASPGGDPAFARTVKIGESLPATGTSRSRFPAIPGFEILAKVGEGGMGVVYKARQLDLNRLVAIKMVLAHRVGRPEDLMRFRLEAEMVARVRHPNVVQVFDSGSLDGHPYLVLEWVDGGTLAGYLKEGLQPPDVGARTVRVLARAIHAAHCNGIIHRDLKPGNILAAGHGPTTGNSSDSARPASRPTSATSPRAGSTASNLDTLNVTLSLGGKRVSMTPKIADFGLAKQLGGDSDLTETGQVLGTPAYMAPEQAVGNRELIGAGTDVYALGVILYQMITGKTPFSGRSTAVTLQQVVEEEPKRPRALQPKVPRDLETICLKCLEKQPARRYETAEALADDLAAFLDRRPITARRTGYLERGWKWAVRKPGIAALAASAVLFFVLGFAGVTWQWRRAVAERDRAETAEATTAAVNRFLIEEMFDVATPERALGQRITAADVLRNASARIDGAFADQPRVAAGVRLAIGNSYRKIGMFDEADRHLSAGLDLRRKELGESHRDTLAAAADRGLLLADMRKWNDAISLLRSVVADAGRQFGADDFLTIEANGRLALVLQQSGNNTEAEPLFKDTLATARRAFGPADPRALTILNDYGLFLQAAGKLPEAEATFREAAEGRAKAFAPTHPQTLESLGNLAVVLDEQNHWADAKKTYEQVLADKQKVLGKDHIDTLSTMNNFAGVVERHGDLDGALLLYNKAYDGFADALGRDNPLTLTARNNIGLITYRIGTRDRSGEQLEQAETVLKEVLAARRRVQPNHPDLFQSANNLAAVCVALKKLDEAEALLAEASAGRRNVIGPGHVETLESVINYAQVLGKRKKFADAVRECQSALAAADQAGNGEHAVTFELLCTLVLARLEQKSELAAAEPLAKRAETLAAKLYGSESRQTVRARRNLGKLLLELNRPDEAEKPLRSVFIFTRAELGDKNPQTIQEGNMLGLCLVALKQFAEAEPLLLEYYEAVRSRRMAPAVIRSAAEPLIKVYEGLNKPEKAAEWREKLK